MRNTQTSGSGTGFPFDLIKTLTLQTEYPDKLMIQRMRKQKKKRKKTPVKRETISDAATNEV